MRIDNNWRKDLPEGFQPIYSGSRPYIAFDANHSRFYFSSAALFDLGLTPGSYIGMAYNKSDDSIIVVTTGENMFIDKKSYVTSRYFANEAGYTSGNIKYEYIPEESDDAFKMFRRFDDE